MIGPGFAAAVGARAIKFIGIAMLIIAGCAGLIGYEIAVWRECAVGHPWWYCLCVLMK